MEKLDPIDEIYRAIKALRSISRNNRGKLLISVLLTYMWAAPPNNINSDIIANVFGFFASPFTAPAVEDEKKQPACRPTPIINQPNLNCRSNCNSVTISQSNDRNIGAQHPLIIKTSNPPLGNIREITFKLSNFDQAIDEYFAAKGNLNTWHNSVYWVGTTSTKIENGKLKGTTRIRYERWERIRLIGLKTRLFRKTFDVHFSIKPELLIGGEGDAKKLKLDFEYQIDSGNELYKFIKIFTSKTDGVKALDVIKLSDLRDKGITCKNFPSEFKKENEDLIITVACDE